MFILYPLVVALIVGLLVGGSVVPLGHIRFRWPAVALLSLGAQLLIFSSPAGELLGDVAPLVYVASTIATLLFVLANIPQPAFPLVAIGAASNLLAIVANGGFMPTTPDALAALGKHLGAGYSNSMTSANVVLAPLTDVFALPRGLPLANVFSVGDVLIGAGVFIFILAVMRRPFDRLPGMVVPAAGEPPQTGG
ncbi:MAG: hypothetical protein XU10_C0013G0024 [Chloroflexi bacterium CSP1-4]|jgi:hypothetical protein|nr:MAG: hypothetical protein XU10_C0013G0024 [Chloroflexi bacterium CSP1-4]